MVKKICGKCGKEILKGQDYLEIKLFENEKMTEKKFAHKKCWEVEIDERKVLQQATGMLRGMQGFMKDNGIMPEVFQV